MIALLSPAKSLDFDTPPATTRTSEPRLADRAEELAAEMATRSAADIRALMKLSEPLAALNAERWAAWQEAADEARPAVLAFDGDAYRGLDAPATFDTRDYTHAQKTLRILSGLYGLLRPLDVIRPHRLEIGTRLPTDAGDDLYAFWGTTITDLLRDDVKASPGAPVLVNLASAEYFAAVEPTRLDCPVVTPVFTDAKGDGPPRVVSFHAKRARGAMAGWIVRERIARASQLEEFTGLGYALDPARSRPDAPVFVRHHPAG